MARRRAQTDKVSKTDYEGGNTGYYIRVPSLLLAGLGYKNANYQAVKAIAILTREIDNDGNLFIKSYVRGLKCGDWTVYAVAQNMTNKEEGEE